MDRRSSASATAANSDVAGASAHTVATLSDLPQPERASLRYSEARKLLHNKSANGADWARYHNGLEAEAEADQSTPSIEPTPSATKSDVAAPPAYAEPSAKPPIRRTGPPQDTGYITSVVTGISLFSIRDRLLRDSVRQSTPDMQNLKKSIALWADPEAPEVVGQPSLPGLGVSTDTTTTEAETKSHVASFVSRATTETQTDAMLRRDTGTGEESALRFSNSTDTAAEDDYEWDVGAEPQGYEGTSARRAPTYPGVGSHAKPAPSSSTVGLGTEANDTTFYRQHSFTANHRARPGAHGLGTHGVPYATANFEQADTEATYMHMQPRNSLVRQRRPPVPARPSLMKNQHRSHANKPAAQQDTSGMETTEELPEVEEGALVLAPFDRLHHPITTVYSRHTDFYPTAGKRYYVPWTTQQRRLCAVIPTYNEPASALHRTLNTLHIQLPKLQERDLDFHVVIVMDGWGFASSSMKMYLQSIFDMPENVLDNGPTWWGDLDKEWPGREVETFVVQRADTRNWQSASVQFAPEDDPAARLNLTLIVKRDNRRKHNTLEWFFRSFAIEYGAEYGFTTDCGTLFEQDTIFHLARHLDCFPRCGGVTGRQRVMTAEQQGDGQEDGFAWWMRAVQGFEYEATYAAFVGAFSVTGFLPVLPGPCGLFNMKHLNGSGVDFFFDKVKQDPDTAGLLLGNGLLAEDRFLSYAAVVSTGKPTITEFVPESIFYFEAETDLKTFVAQRRRWNNGTLACFIWLAKNLDLVRNSPHGLVFRLMTQFLILWQVIWITFSLFSPAFFTVLIRLATRHTFPANETFQSFWADMIPLVYLVLYVAFIIKHTSSKFEGWMFHIFTLIHMLTVMFIVTTFVDAAISKRDRVVELTLYVFAVYQGAPVLLSLIVSPRSGWQMLKYFIPFMLFLPTQTMTFWTYSLTRTFDLTWGNRPTTHRAPADERGTVVSKLKEHSLSVIGIVATINILISVFLMQLAVAGEVVTLIWVLVALMAFAGVQMFLSSFFAFEYHVVRRFRRFFRDRKLRRRRAKYLKQMKRQLVASGSQPKLGPRGSRQTLLADTEL